VNIHQRLSAFFLLTLVSIFGAACAAPTPAITARNQRLLTEAGFKPIPSNKIYLLIPNRQQPPPNTFVHARNNGYMFYFVTDELNHQLYMGSPAAYQRYRELAHAYNLPPPQY
jgi:hypothetical protein